MLTGVPRGVAFILSRAGIFGLLLAVACLLLDRSVDVYPNYVIFEVVVGAAIGLGLPAVMMRSAIREDATIILIVTWDTYEQMVWWSFIGLAVPIATWIASDFWLNLY